MDFIKELKHFEVIVRLYEKVIPKHKEIIRFNITNFNKVSKEIHNNFRRINSAMVEPAVSYGKMQGLLRQYKIFQKYKSRAKIIESKFALLIKKY